MDWIKRNWWLLLICPVVLYFVYRYIVSKYEMQKKMQVVREAKEEKRILNDTDFQDLEDAAST